MSISQRKRIMERERRNSTNFAQANLEEMLNAAQQQALPGMKYTGWVLRCLRKPLFTAPLLIVQNINDGRIGIMDVHGRIRVQANIKLREQDKLIQDPAPVEPLVWTK